ncbi:hypothetical protein MRS44_003911 [Fusarium solani]|uniref:uncharacterized protein n=1 Tax=Fusarium solani TaxID=169388 RepID=UPI0032C3E421|nr:hypothetical protein MRS44_003911 [Fusarium solani]
MRSAQHTAWIQFGDQENVVSVSKTSCLEDRLAFASGRPSLVLFVGGKAKARTISKLATPSPRAPWNDAVIHLRPQKGVRRECPILFADGPVPCLANLPKKLEDDTLPWKSADATDAVTALYSRVFTPLADIVCVFLSDFGDGWDGLAQFIACWLRFRPKANHTTLRPVLLIVSECTSIQELREKKGLLFDKNHFNILCDRAYSSFTQQSDFNHIDALLSNVPRGANIARGVEEFLRHLRDEDQCRQFGLPMVASAIVLDAFPMGMHGFHASHVFREMYEKDWEKISERLGLDRSLVITLRHVIEERYSPGSHASIPLAHAKLAQSFSRIWETLSIDGLCLMCLCSCRPALFSLPCGHSFCETDIRRFGRRMGRRRFRIDVCFLCQKKADLVFILKPKTKGVSLLSIDGGGVRGVIPLTNLKGLQDELGKYLGDFSVQTLFDLTVGTSSGSCSPGQSGSIFPSLKLTVTGGLIALAISLLGMPIEECLRSFQELSRHAFRPRFARWPGTLSSFANMLFAILAGSVYPGKNLDAPLKNLFGSDTTLHSHLLPGNMRGAKVAVTVSEKSAHYSEPQACIIANFAHDNSRKRHSPYEDIHPESSQKRMRLWEAYFPPHQRGASAYLDGGMWRNNPVDVVEREARHLWPELPEADLVLTLGTGYNGDEREVLPVPSSVPKDGRSCKSWMGQKAWSCVKAIFTSYSNSVVMDGHKFHCLLSDTCRNRNRPYCRIDTQLSDPVPALDDVGSMTKLMDSTSRQCSGKIKSVAQSCIANLFYVELLREPFRDRGGFWAEGHILCNVDEKESLNRLINTLAREGYKFQVGRQMMPIMRKHCFETVEQEYQMHFSLTLDKMDSPFHVFLCAPDGVSRPVSASPFTLRSLLKTQNWDSMLHFDKTRLLENISGGLCLDEQVRGDGVYLSAA